MGKSIKTHKQRHTAIQKTHKHPSPPPMHHKGGTVPWLTRFFKTNFPKSHEITKTSQRTFHTKFRSTKKILRVTPLMNLRVLKMLPLTHKLTACRLCAHVSLQWTCGARCFIEPEELGIGPMRPNGSSHMKHR